MGVQLPESIAAFFRVSNGADVSALKRCFTEDAVVSDERHAYRGQKAIQAWLQEAQHKYAYRVEPLDFVVQGSHVEVRAMVSGRFPGSPVELAHVFRLRGESIESLEIH